MQGPLVLAVCRQWLWHKCHCQYLYRPSCHPKYQGHYSTFYGKSQATVSSFKEGAYALAAIWNLHWYLLGRPGKHRCSDLDSVVIGFGRKSLMCQTLSVNRFYKFLDRFNVFVFAWIHNVVYDFFISMCESKRAFSIKVSSDLIDTELWFNWQLGGQWRNGLYLTVA